MFIGPGGSGKTSLMYRLIHRQPHLLYISTGVADPVIIVDIFYAVSVLGPHTWQQVKFDQSLLGQMRERYFTQLKQATTKIPQVSTTAPSQSRAYPAAPEPTPSVSNTTSGADRPVVTAAPPASPSPLQDPLSEVITSAVVKHGGYASFDTHLRKKFHLYLRDAGGQVEFQEMVALLVFGPSLFLFVFRADQDMKSTFQVGYRTSASESINCYTSSITTEEALLQCLASVYAMETPDKASFHNHHPYVLIVATHKDKQPKRKFAN